MTPRALDHVLVGPWRSLCWRFVSVGAKHFMPVVFRYIYIFFFEGLYFSKNCAGKKSFLASTLAIRTALLYRLALKMHSRVPKSW